MVSHVCLADCVSGSGQYAELWRSAYWVISSSMGRSWLAFVLQRCERWLGTGRDGRSNYDDLCLYLSEDGLDSAHVKLETGRGGVN